MCNWNWELILEYVKALAWPVLIGAIVLLFRSQIAARIQALREVEGLGVKAKMDGEVKELGEKVDAAADRVDSQPPPEPEPPSDESGQQTGPMPPRPPDSPPGSSSAEGDTTQEDGERAAEAERQRLDLGTARLREQALALFAAAERLLQPAEFGTALEVASVSPNAAVMLAYTELEKVVRAAWTVTTMEPVSPRHSSSSIMRELTANLGPEFPGLARELSEVRNRVAHGTGEVSLDGALNFVASCQRLAEVIGRRGASKLRHPSRAQVLKEAWDVLGLDDDRTAQPMS